MAAEGGQVAAKGSELFSMRDDRTQTPADDEYARGLADYFEVSLGGAVDKLRHFPKYAPRQAMSLFLAKNELFKQALNVHGHIVECGVFLGGGLMTWAQLSAVYEPYNHVRRIVGFDTFSGFPSLSGADQGADQAYAVANGLATDAKSDIEQAVRLYDLNRPVGHIPRVELAVGDATATIPRYVDENPHLVVALLYLDFDIYEPTKAAIEHLLPRMPKGAIIAFDELCQKSWPGETRAVQDLIGIRNLRIQRFPFTPQLSYAVLD
jgi:hypothetical protein